jgi:hypothetical protein
MFLSILALAAAQAPATDYQSEVERAVFDLCPQMMAGTFSVADEAQLTAAGYTATAPRQTPSGAIPRAVRGSGAEQIVIAGRTGGEAPMCSVWFAGHDNDPAADAVKRRARHAGFSGNAMRLGDGTRMTVLRSARTVPPRLIILMDADAAGEFGGGAATTVVVMNSQE